MRKLTTQPPPTDAAMVQEGQNRAAIESAVLGAILLESSTHHHLGELKSDYFSFPKMAAICQKMAAIYEEGGAIDMLTVANAMRGTGVTAYDVASLTSRVSDSSNITHYIALLKQEWMRGVIARASSHITNEALTGGDVFELEAKMSDLLAELGGVITAKPMATASEKAAAYLEKLAEQMAKVAKGEVVGVRSGVDFFDEITGGWFAGDVNVLAARPGMGKTALALQLAIYTAKANPDKSVVFFSLEMSAEQLIARMFSGLANVSTTMMRQVKLSPDDFARMANIHHLIPENLVLDDSVSQAGPAMTARLKHYQATSKKPLALVVVDYLQLMDGVGENQNVKVAGNSRRIKQTALQMGCTFLVLSQLNREKTSRPTLTQLRDSGSIEQDADAVMFLHNPTADEASHSREFYAAKNRHGVLFHEWLDFEGRHMTFAKADGPPPGFDNGPQNDFF